MVGLEWGGVLLVCCVTLSQIPHLNCPVERLGISHGLVP